VLIEVSSNFNGFLYKIRGLRARRFNRAINGCNSRARHAAARACSRSRRRRPPPPPPPAPRCGRGCLAPRVPLPPAAVAPARAVPRFALLAAPPPLTPPPRILAALSRRSLGPSTSSFSGLSAAAGETASGGPAPTSAAAAVAREWGGVPGAARAVRVVGGQRARSGGDPRGVRGGVGAARGDGTAVGRLGLRLRLRRLRHGQRERERRRRQRDDRDRAGGRQPHRDRHLQVPVMDVSAGRDA
jgi:hypothetical protein